ncbi:MAG TPA: hypothetical protein VGX23_21365 [Actinocrinis sp.]|nr:hypothetical protein [Actinocrinis sp.]
MSRTGYWIIGALGQEALDALLERIGASAFEQLPSDLDVGWWHAMDDVDVAAPAHLGYGPTYPSDPAVLFQEELSGLRPDPDVLDVCVAAIGEVTEADRFVVAVRKGDPIAALFYGLGSAAAQRVPGRGGCFLVHSHAQADLAELMHLLDVSAPERVRFTDRVSQWLTVMGDQPDLDPLELLDGPLRLVNRARETRSGLVSVMQWY